MYDHGYGVPENDAEAVKWFRKATEQGVADAQLNLGVNYGNGTGVPKDYVKAHMWFSLTKAQGNKDASDYLDIVKELMTLNMRPPVPETLSGSGT